jgi:hypothetical protein
MFSCFAPGKMSPIFYGKETSWMGPGVLDVGAAKEILPEFELRSFSSYSSVLRILAVICLAEIANAQKEDLFFLSFYSLSVLTYENWLGPASLTYLHFITNQHIELRCNMTAVTDRVSLSELKKHTYMH